MRGLEIIEVNLSKAIENKDLRIDSDFWTKEPRKNSKLKYEKIGALLKKSQYGISISMNGDKIGYPIYRMNEIHNMMCDLNVDKYADISKDEFEKFKLNDRDVLFNRTNSYEWVGRTGIYRKTNKREFIFASYLVRFVPDEKIINPEYLTAYLNTKYGEREIKRRARRSINQTNVNPEEVKEICIPLLCKNIQNFIKNVFSKAHTYRLKSDDMINSAKTLLLETIGLKNFTPNAKAICVENFKNSYHQTGRLDAEYYQRKYEELIEVVKNHKEGANVLENFVDSYSTGFPFQSETYAKDGVYLIRINNVQRGNLDLSDAIKVPFTDAATLSPKNIAKENDILISMSGTIGNSCKIPKGVEAVINQRIFRFTPKNYDPEVLSLIINSIIGLHQLNRIGTGGVQTNISSSDILKIQIPSLSLTAQSQISSLIEKSFALKAESERLLNVAKRAVEIAIEQDEESATKWIQEQLNINQ